jgi:hypothetical protein
MLPVSDSLYFITDIRYPRHGITSVFDIAELNININQWTTELIQNPAFYPQLIHTFKDNLIPSGNKPDFSPEVRRLKTWRRYKVYFQ